MSIDVAVVLASLAPFAAMVAFLAGYAKGRKDEFLQSLSPDEQKTYEGFRTGDTDWTKFRDTVARERELSASARAQERPPDARVPLPF